MTMLPPTSPSTHTDAERLILVARRVEDGRYLFAQWGDWPHPTMISTLPPSEHEGFVEGIESLLRGRMHVRVVGTPQLATERVAVRMAHPRALLMDAGGNLLYGDVGNHRVRRLAAGTGIITTLAGNGTAGLSGDGGPGNVVGGSPGASIACPGGGGGGSALTSPFSGGTGGSASWGGAAGTGGTAGASTSGTGNGTAGGAGSSSAQWGPGAGGGGGGATMGGTNGGAGGAGGVYGAGGGGGGGGNTSGAGGAGGAGLVVVVSYP
jgi:hypothetical protein